MASPAVDYDVLIIGAGISGINAAYRLQTELPHLTFTVLEGRATLGGTWDFFRYPGIRSDSDLFTFCFPWHAWDHEYPIAEGATILHYIQQAASKHGIDRRIEFQHRMTRASWSSSDQIWQLTVESPEGTSIYRSRFLILGTGFYNYSQALKTEIPGLQQFQGQVVHPQFWPDELDYRDQKIVVIGSGATAITMIPKLAEQAAHTTMLQRSPTYIVSAPNRQLPSASSWLARWLPRSRFYSLQRLLSLVHTRLFILFCERWPHLARAYLRSHVRRQLPPAVAYDPHFAPLYAPMEQRLCVSPDADFFRSLHTGRVGVVTDTIETCTATGIQLRSGQHLDADLIITATGLQMQFAGGAMLDIDGVPVDLSSKFIWNGMMLQDLPNLIVVNGYTNASWTLGADATMIAVCRLIKLLQARGHTVAVPRVDPQGPPLTPRPTFALTSTYIHAAARFMPRVAAEKPWQRRDNYFTDLWFAKYGDLEHGLQFIPGSGFRRSPTGGGEKPKEVKKRD